MYERVPASTLSWATIPAIPKSITFT
jgi:hypothetical protein